MKPNATIPDLTFGHDISRTLTSFAQLFRCSRRRRRAIGPLYRPKRTCDNTVYHDVRHQTPNNVLPPPDAPGLLVEAQTCGPGRRPKWRKGSLRQERRPGCAQPGWWQRTRPGGVGWKGLAGALGGLAIKNDQSPSTTLLATRMDIG